MAAWWWLACRLGLHDLKHEMTRLGRRVVCRRCEVRRWLRGVDVR